MLLRLYQSANGIKGKPGHLLTLNGNYPIVYEGLESLSIFTLKHHTELLSASVAVISLLSVNVEGFQEVESPGIEHFPVLRLMGEWEMEGGSFPVILQVRHHAVAAGDAAEAWETSLCSQKQSGN